MNKRISLLLISILFTVTLSYSQDYVTLINNKSQTDSSLIYLKDYKIEEKNKEVIKRVIVPKMARCKLVLIPVSSEKESGNFVLYDKVGNKHTSITENGISYIDFYFEKRGFYKCVINHKAEKSLPILYYIDRNENIKTAM